jgi:hypothetical protein
VQHGEQAADTRADGLDADVVQEDPQAANDRLDKDKH